MTEHEETPISRTTPIQLGTVILLGGLIVAGVGYAYKVQTQVEKFGVTLDLKLDNQNERIHAIAADVAEIRRDVSARVTADQVSAKIAESSSILQRHADRLESRIEQLETEVGRMREQGTSEKGD